MSEPQLRSDAFLDTPRTLSFDPVSREPSYLGEHQIKEYNTLGYLSNLFCLDTDAVGEVRDFYSWMQKRLARRAKGFMLNHNWESRSGFLHNLVSTRINLAPVRDIVGQNILAWQTHFFTKLPYEATPVAWHQDASYWPLTPSRAVTAWIAIDATDNENGAMSVIPGSHLYGQLPYISGEAGKTSSVYQTAWKPECYGDSVQLSLAPGEMSLHSDLLLHASGPNLSSRSRCGLVIRFIPPSVRNVRKPGGDSAILCSGTSEDRYWKIRTQPVLR